MNALTRILASAVCGFLLAPAAAAKEINRTLDAAAEGSVLVENTAGTVQVRGWPEAKVEVRGQLGKDVEQLDFERNGNETRIVVRKQKGRNRDIDSDLVIMVPEKSSLTVGGVSTDIDVEDVQGILRLRTVSGSVSSEVFAADAEIDTVSGDIEVRGQGSNGFARLNSVSGDIEVRKLAGELDLNTVSGDLTVADGSWSRGNANTTSGDIRLQAGLQSGGRLDVETINGDVELDFLGDLSATFDIESFNGDISSCFGPEAVRTSEYTPGRRLKFTEGGGAGRVTIRTLNGDLEMCRD